jgi:hypothetical protein
MQHTIYKPHQINDEVFCIFITPELPMLPLLVKCLVSNYVSFGNTTYYHVLPLKLIESNDFIKSNCEQLTFRTIDKFAHIKDVTIIYDSTNNLTWSQQFALNYDNLLLDVQMQSVFDDFNIALTVIHNIYANILNQLQQSSMLISNRLTSSYLKECL